MKAFFKLASFLYGGIVSARGLAYDLGVLRQYRSALPVVSVGNITAGGNGKTPLCLFLAEQLAERGMRPVILSRGYGGSHRGPHRVQPSDSPGLVGDEPLLMAQQGVAPVYISRARARGARRIEEDRAGDVIILDDGFQHRALARNVDIVSIFAGTPLAVEQFAEGKMLPEGLFREPRDRALKRASLFVVSERRVLASHEALGALDERLLATLPQGTSVYRAFFEAQGVCWMESGEPLSPGRVQAMAAIANPATFFESLSQMGFDLAACVEYPDHHSFSEADVRELLAKAPGVPLVCTAKDAVKLRAMPAEVRQQVAVLSVKLKVVPADAFMVHVHRKLLSGVVS